MTNISIFGASAIIALLLTGCGTNELTEKEKLIADAKQTVAASLKDPESAKFRSLDVYVDKKIVCGEINGKNGYGAYAGFSPFYYQSGYGQITDYDSIFYPRYEEVCLGALRAKGEEALASAAARAAALEDGPEKTKLIESIRDLQAEGSGAANR